MKKTSDILDNLLKSLLPDISEDQLDRLKQTDQYNEVKNSIDEAIEEAQEMEFDPGAEFVAKKARNLLSDKINLKGEDP